MRTHIPAMEARTPSFLVKQYNILAGHLGNNHKPWFMFGANLTDERRDMVLQAYQLKVKNNVTGKDEWPNTWENNHYGNDAEGKPLISSSQVEKVDQIEKDVFSWEHRSHALVKEMLRDSPEVLLLEEVDNYQNFFMPELDK